MSPTKLPMKPAPKKAGAHNHHDEGNHSSTIATIINKEEVIKGFTVAKGVTLIASKKQCPEILNEVKNLLLV